MPGTGTITTEHTVWCGQCEQWETFNSRTIAATIREAKAAGWKKRKGVWVCPECAVREPGVVHPRWLG